MKFSKDFLGGAVDKNQPSNVGAWVRVLVRIDSTFRGVTSERMYHNY